MKDGKAEKAIKDRIDAAIETSGQDDQADLEAAVLATLAGVINGDESDLKYDLLDMDGGDFLIGRNQDAFNVMKMLALAGDHVDQLTVQEKGASWPDLTKAVPAEAAQAYKRRIIARGNIRQAAKIVREYQEAVAAAAPEDLPGLIAALQGTVFDVEKTKRFAPPVRPEADLVKDFMLALNDPPGYRTGFDKLDKLTRGLKPGVFILAAPPSAGKTTFIKQMADQVADLNEGVPVLFLSYEQSAAELRIKSMARLGGIDNEWFRTWRDPKMTAIPEHDLNSLLKSSGALAKYQALGRRLKIIEADFHHNIGTIRLMAQREKLMTGKAPAIFVDYLQVVPAADPALKDKRSEVDYLVSEFRRLARDIGSPVIIVSSMSRAEYGRVQMSGFKESGGIEYGADIAAIMSVLKETDGTERSIDLAIIKNRNGRRKKINFQYEMKYDAFTEGDAQDLDYLKALGIENNE